jgi:hypothetical protein
MIITDELADNFFLVTVDGAHGTHTVARTIALAAEHGIALDAGDFTFDEDGYASIDDMAPGEWLQAMLMD